MATTYNEGRSKRGIKNRNVSETAGIEPHKLDLNAKFFYDDFGSGDPVCVAPIGAGAATGTGGDENLMQTAMGKYRYHILGTQTIVAPTEGTEGLDINSLDQTDDDGVEYVPGGSITSASRVAFTVGTHDCFIKAKFDITDVSGTDDCAVGFRKAEAFQANLDDYDELACLNVISGNINIETILNGGTTDTTDTTDNWADNEQHTLEVYVDEGGWVTYKLDGNPVTTSAEFQFDNGEVIIPFIYVLNSADVAGEIDLVELTVGTSEMDVR